MKKKFITPEIEFFKLSSEDILCASDDVINAGDDKGFTGSDELDFGA